MKFSSATIISIIIITIVSIYISTPLIRQGLFTIHDDQQVARLYLYDKALKDGQLPPRIVDGLGFGFGYALFVFYPPLVYMIGELIHVFGVGFVDSVKIVFFLSILLSGWFMFYFLRKYIGNLAATFSSICYLLLPYRAVDVYVRGALSEAFSFVWVPPLILSLFALSQDKNKSNITLSAVFIALLLLTHNLIFIAFLVLLPVFSILFVQEKNKMQLLYAFGLSMMIGAGLSAFFWIPSLMEKSNTIVDQILLTELANYKIHFVHLHQLWNSIWGYGGSTEGTLDGLSFKVGKIHLVASLVSIALILLPNYLKNYSSHTFQVQRKLLLLMIAMLVISIFMSTAFSKPVWEIFQPLTYLQFPWRFLIFIGFATSVLAGYFIYLLKLSVLKISTFIILTILVLYTNSKLFKPQSYRQYFNDEFATSDEIINWDVSRSSFEYLPRGVDLTKSPINTSVVNIKKEEIASNPVSVLSGQVEISQLKSSSNMVAFTTRSNEGAHIMINKANFHLWNLEIDGKKATYMDGNKFKLVEFDVPAGEHVITLEHKNTWPRTAGNLITGVTLLSLVPFIKWKKKN